jgi:hypothetical protein
MGFATFCWFFSIMVFAHPEKPFNYRVLARFDKLDPLRKFTNYTVPQGKFLPARDLLVEFYAFNHEQLSVKNDLLKRSYIRNYKQEQPLYVKGTFQVINARPLTKSDVITEGWVIRARSADIEDVDVEIVLPGNKDKTDPYQVGTLSCWIKRAPSPRRCMCRSSTRSVFASLSCRSLIRALPPRTASSSR